MPGLGQRVTQRRDDQPARDPWLAEPDLGLGGMYVDVHPLRRAVDEEGDGGVPVTAEEIRIGSAQRADQQFVAHRANRSAGRRSR